MKKILGLAVIAMLSLTACDGSTNGGDDNQQGNTTLRVQNESYTELTQVVWNGVSFGTIETGGYTIGTVEPGTGLLHFRRKTDPITVYREEAVIVVAGEDKEIRINDNTIIVETGNTGNRGTLGTLNRGPQLTIQQDDTAIEKFGDFSFGTVRIGNQKDLTFTIGNSGGGNLNFTVVDGNVINLTDNASGYFSVVQQPFASMDIAPGGTNTFILRFSPAVTGNSFNAIVQIRTNSSEDADFQFRINGNGANTYSIGDTGPGDGTVFFASGGQYMEVSVELGTYNWSMATTIAGNYLGGGLTGWRLPDRGEVDLMYENLHRQSLGGFLNSTYWSSSEDPYRDAYFKDFTTGRWSAPSNSKSQNHRVRAVRSFTLY